MFVSRAVAPVRKGDAWAKAGCGKEKTTANETARATATGDAANAAARAILLDMTPLRF
jgi:hypothetical protein